MAAVMKTATAIGSVASFWSPKPAAIKSLKVYFEPKQAGEGDPSPDNPRPIEGWTGVETWKTGKNLFDENSAIFGYWTSANGTADPNIHGVRSNYIPTEGGSTYTVMYHGTPPYSYSFIELDENYNFVTRTHKQIYGTSDSFYKPLSATMQDKTKYFYIQTYVLGEQMTSEYLSSIKIQLEYGNSASDYEPYIDNKTTISWESQIGTVYGGYVDLISGELTVTKSKYTFTGSEADGITFYGQITDSSGVDRNIFRTKIFDRYFVNGSTRFLSSNIALPHLTENRQRKPEIMIYIGTPINQVQFYSKTSLCEPTVESFCSFLNEHNIELVGLLANPVTHQLTPQQLSAFIGRNNLFSNASNIEVEYEYADSPELEVIKKRIALNEPHISNASGSTANFYTDMASPMKSLKVNFEAKQTGSGNASPDNIRPITGVDQINVCRTGKNLCHIIGYSAKTHSTLLANRVTQNDYGTSISTINYTSPDTPLVVTQSSYDESKAPNHYNNGFFALMLDSLVFGQTYNISFKITDILSNPLNVSPSIINIGTPSGYEQRPTEVQGDKIIYKNVKYEQSKSHDAQYFFIRCCGMSYTMSEFMVTEATEEDQTYEPYEGDIIPCSFSELGTQYGGYVDLVNGTLTKTWIGVTRKLSEAYKVVDYDTTLLYDHRFMFDSYVVNNWQTQKCSIAPYSWNLENGKIHFYVYSGTISADCNSRAMIYMPPETDPETEFTLALQLQDPITYQLTPQQIKTFRGTNNIYSFDGTVDVKYWLHSDQKVTRKTVVWNQWMKPLTADNYRPYNETANYTAVTYSGDIATVEWLQNQRGYLTAIIPKYNIPITVGDVLYESHMIYPNVDGIQWGVEFAGGIQLTYGVCPGNQWTRIPYIRTSIRTQNTRLYVPNLKTSTIDPTGVICSVKSLYLINLTTMFGAGNEPTDVEEFEHLCAINGVDLTKPQVYDEGTERSWIIN